MSRGVGTFDQLLVLLAAWVLAGMALAADYWLPGLLVGGAALSAGLRLAKQTGGTP